MLHIVDAMDESIVDGSIVVLKVCLAGCGRRDPDIREGYLLCGGLWPRLRP